MSRLKFAILAACAGIFITPALAGNPHFISSYGGIDAKTGDYTAKFKEAGLGNTPITYGLDATTQYTFQCFTKSGNNPKGAPNAGGASNENTTTTVTPRNGQVTATIVLDVTYPPTTALPAPRERGRSF